MVTSFEWIIGLLIETYFSGCGSNETYFRDRSEINGHCYQWMRSYHVDKVSKLNLEIYTKNCLVKLNCNWIAFFLRELFLEILEISVKLNVLRYIKFNAEWKKKDLEKIYKYLLSFVILA